MASTNWKGFRALAWGGIALLAIAIVVVLVQRNFLAAASLAGFLIAATLFLKFDDHLPRLFDLLFVLAALINAGGWAWDLYNQPGPYDEIAHFFTIFAMTLAIGYLLFNRMFESFYDHRVLFIIMIASLGIAMGALWEVGEWTADFFVAKQIVSGLDDTMSDIILDTLGALLAASLNVYALHERSVSSAAAAMQAKGNPRGDDRRVRAA